ncbi:MAG: hypothetical protein HOM18_09485, partial [Candidatus Marinimicrobia bacterium]|nr:hypothetical protein [Candidatus Neomarinimicrobiota bacterium]
STETGSNGDVRVMESTWDDTNKTNTWSESYTNADKSLDYTKTEVYNETTQTSTMTTTGTSDHIGWMYVGEIFTNMNIVETRDANWNTTGLSGTATNAAKETVNFGWDDGEITLDGDILSIHGPGDFSMSADNFQNEWTYFDHDGIEWTVVESEQDGTWVSEETSENGDVRVNSNYWDNDAKESKNVTKFKSSDGDIKYKMTETWAEDGSSVLEVLGDTDHIGWDYVGQVFTDIDVVITRNSNWEIQTVKNSDGDAATAKDQGGQSVTLSFDANNDITIDGVSIYRLGDDFFKDFDTNMMGQLDQMQTGSWEFEYNNQEGHLIKVVEESVATDIVTIKTDALDITLVFDLEGKEGSSVPISVLSSKGIPEGLSGFDYSSLETWYFNDVVDEMDEGNHDDAAELAIVKTAVTNYLSSKSISDAGLEVSFAIADTFTTKETNQNSGQIFLRTRTENLGSETEREANYNSEADLTNNNPSWWVERVRTFDDSEYGFKETSVETSSTGTDLTIVTNYAPDGTVTIVATGTEVMGEGDQIMVMNDIYVTSLLEDGWKYTDFFGTGTIGNGQMKGMEAVITSDGTDPYGGPLIHVTVDVGAGNASDGGQFEHILTYEEAGRDVLREAQLHDMGNPLDRYIIQDTEGFASSKNYTWDQTSFDNETVKGTTTFTGENSKQTQTVNVTEVRTTDDAGMLSKIVQTVTSTKGDSGESYTRTFTLNERFDVEIELTGTKVLRGETYKNIDMDTEITPNGDVRIEGTANKLDGANVDFFKGHHDQSMEITSINRDGTIQKMTEDEQDSGGSDNQGPINEL